MKKVCIMILMLALLASFAVAAKKDNAEPCKIGKLSLTVTAGMRNVSDDMYKNVYDKGAVTYGIDLGFKLSPAIEVFAHTDIFSVDGQLTFTHEDTTLDIMPIELGFRYHIAADKSCKLKLFPYIGAGAGFYKVKEENAIGTFDKSQAGFFVEGGLRFYVAGPLFLDGKLKYITLSVTPDEGSSVKLGGFAYMGGIGISL